MDEHDRVHRLSRTKTARHSSSTTSASRSSATNFTLADDALDDAFLPFPFDLEGLPKRRVALIERGIVRTPVVDKAYADRLGFAPTANGWSLGGADHGSALHLSIDGGDATREELIRSTKHGIWVTRFNYVNGLLEPKTALMTGTTRDGTFLIRDGEVVARLPNLRWTQSIVEAFSRIEGTDARAPPRRHLVQPLRRYDRAGDEDRGLELYGEAADSRHARSSFED